MERSLFFLIKNLKVKSIHYKPIGSILSGEKLYDFPLTSVTRPKMFTLATFIQQSIESPSPSS